jgi:hypothetical protein
MAAQDDSQQIEEKESATQSYENPGEPVASRMSAEKPPAEPDAIQLIPDFLGRAGLGLALSVLVLVALFALLDAAWLSAQRLPTAPERPSTRTFPQQGNNLSQTAPDRGQAK